MSELTSFIFANYYFYSGIYQSAGSGVHVRKESTDFSHIYPIIWWITDSCMPITTITNDTTGITHTSFYNRINIIILITDMLKRRTWFQFMLLCKSFIRIWPKLCNEYMVKCEKAKRFIWINCLWRLDTQIIFTFNHKLIDANRESSPFPPTVEKPLERFTRLTD